MQLQRMRMTATGGSGGGGSGVGSGRTGLAEAYNRCTAPRHQLGASACLGGISRPQCWHGSPQPPDRRKNRLPPPSGGLIGRQQPFQTTQNSIASVNGAAAVLLALALPWWQLARGRHSSCWRLH